MLQPKKSNKKPSPAKKYKTSQSEVDWDLVRNINDNPAVQAAKMFDPTGISSYPDVYYAAKDLAEGKGSWAELGINVLGALPMVGKAKVAFRLAKAGKGSKTVKATQKVMKTVEKVAQKSNKAVNAPINKIKPLANSTKVVPKVIGKTAEKTEQLAKAMGKPLTPKGQTITSKQITKSDVKNVAVDLLDISNVAADVSNTVTATTKKVKEVQDKKEAESYQPVPKKVVYYSTDPKRGEVEKPGTDPNVFYTPVTNSIQLKKWQEQQLAYGTNSQGIMKNKMNPRKKYANGTNTKGVGPNNYIETPNEVLNDYNIMLGQVEAKAASNPWLPIAAIIGGAAQSFVGKGINATPTPAKTAANGDNNVQADVEMEGGEVIETPGGEVAELEGPSHEQGGMPMQVGKDVPAGTKVYSDRLVLGGKTLAERKAIRESRAANLQKNLEKNKTDIAIKNAVSRKLSALDMEEERDLQFQEQVNNMQMMADHMMKAFGTGAGGVQKMGKGGVVGDPPAYGKGSDGQYYTANTFKLPFNYWSAKLQETEGDKYRVRSLDNVDDRKEFQRFFYKDNQGKDLSGQKIPYTDKDSGVSFIQNYTIDGILGQTALAQSVQGVGTDYANYMDADGNLFPNTQEAIKNKVPVTLANNPNLNFDVLKNFKIGDGINDNASLSYGDPYAKNGVNFEMPTETIMTPISDYGQGVGTEETKKEPSKFAKALEGNMPTVGDITKLIGNYLGMTAGIKTAGEQRSTDVTHTNVFKDAGKESQKLLDNAKNGINISKAQAMSKATAVSRGGKRGGRNSARGVNQMRAIDWMYDTALNQQLAEISANTAKEISAIDIQKSGVAMNADQLKGQGEYQANMANEAAKDAYYTALGLGRKDFATGVQQTGKDLNDMKENKIVENLMKHYGKYVTADASGLKAKNAINPEEEVFTAPDGKKYKKGKDGKLIEVK